MSTDTEKFLESLPERSPSGSPQLLNYGAYYARFDLMGTWQGVLYMASLLKALMLRASQTCAVHGRFSRKRGDNQGNRTVLSKRRADPEG
jgi:hypothetical protein